MAAPGKKIPADFGRATAENFDYVIIFTGITEVAERTQTSISVKTAAGLDFCHYQNIPGRTNGVLYPGACMK